jgi:hypothetical protein
MDNASDNVMNFRLKLSIAAYIAALNIILVTALIYVWPGAGSADTVLQERRYMMIAVIAGALGSYIHLATSFVEHAGRKVLETTYAWWYFLRPMVGSALALMVYFVLRAGLISGSADGGGAANPYGVAAMSGLSGMFSRQATEKLREIFENVCAVDNQRTADKVRPSSEEGSDGPQEP